MKNYIELGRHREFGNILSDTFTFVKQNFKPLFKAYFALCGVFLLANILVSAFAHNGGGSTPSDFDDGSSSITGIVILEYLFAFVNYTALLVTTLSYLAVYKEKDNTPPEVVEVWGYFKYYFFRVFFTNIIVSIGAVLGFIFCFFPGIYLSIVFSMICPIMIMENGNIEYSFKKAFKMLKEKWWFTFGILILISIIIFMGMLILMVPPMIIYGSGQWITGKQLSGAGSIIFAVMLNICQLLWILPIIAVSLVYFSIIEEKESNSLLNRIKMFGKNKRDTNQLSSEQY